VGGQASSEHVSDLCRTGLVFNCGYHRCDMTHHAVCKQQECLPVGRAGHELRVRCHPGGNVLQECVAVQKCDATVCCRGVLQECDAGSPM
jgi:hypothetical protein